jgi:predicted MFS family arabinose efflux permease
LVQGILQGLGNGLRFTLAIALVSSYFPAQKRAVPLRLLICGGASGRMDFPAVAQSTLTKTGFTWTVRCIRFVILSTHAVVLTSSKPVVKKGARAAHKSVFLDASAVKDTPYLLFCLGIFLGFWGLFFTYFYVRSYVFDVLGVSEQSLFTMILLINSTGIPGRTIPDLLADSYFGALDVHIPFVFITGLLMMC